MLAAMILAVVTWSSSPVVAALTLVIGMAIGGAMMATTLRRVPHVPWERAQEQVADGRAVVFWKPTCSYCTRLRKAFGDDNRIVWVNVWVDPSANREVRRHNGGDEYTPTALVGNRVLRNPTAAELRSALR